MSSSSIAYQCYLSLNVKSQLIQVAFADHGHMNVQIGIAHIGILHILEKFLFEFIVEVVRAFRQGL